MGLGATGVNTAFVLHHPTKATALVTFQPASPTPVKADVLRNMPRMSVTCAVSQWVSGWLKEVARENVANTG